MAIVSDRDATPSEKYYKIETLSTDYREAGDADLKKIEKLEANIAAELNNETYYALLESQSLRLQRRVSGVAKAVKLDTATSDPTLIAAIQHFKDTDGRIGGNPPIEFLNKQESAAVFRDKLLVTPLYKCLLFIHMADGSRPAASISITRIFTERYRITSSHSMNGGLTSRLCSSKLALRSTPTACRC